MQMRPKGSLEFVRKKREGCMASFVLHNQIGFDGFWYCFILLFPSELSSYPNKA